ncbi:MAG: HAD family hydrolase [Eubacteriales bacterium]|nr:HAD family hydrolase [Eubacteriales bacterium]
MKGSIFFDLDGTLTDPSEGICAAVRYALTQMEIPVPQEAVLRSFIGPPLQNSFEHVLGLSPHRATQALQLYRWYYGKQGLFENQVYDGIYPLLNALKTQGRRLVLATSKPEQFAVKILEHFSLLSYFDFLGCASIDDTRREKADVLRYALAQTNICACDAVMIGDRCYDIQGANTVGMEAIGVLYGFGTRQELCKSGASALVSSPAQLLSMLCKE